jgi:DNA-binding winged helix-turn-helix (wHTH) protein/tetratricopeptide (TPR) repeat protein
LKAGGFTMKVFPPFRLDTGNQCLWRQGDGGAEERILLKPKVFDVLRYLVEHAGRLVAQEELLEAVWPDTYVQPEVLKRHIFDVRQVLGDDPKSPRFIETQPRRGYQFIAAVRDDVAEPAAANTAAQATLVGRDRALGELEAYLTKACSGQRQIVFITGEPGIGKTALVDEFQRRAASHLPLRIACGQCVEGYGGKEAYYPVLEALGDLCRGPFGETAARILTATAPTWLVQFPSLIKREQRETLKREIQGATRQRMLREIGEALEEISADSPLMLVLEDLHWGDNSTVDFISALARGRRPARLLLVATYRPLDVTLSDNPLKVVKQDLLLHRLCHELALQPLGEMEIEAYLAAESSDTTCVPQGLAALLHRHTEGNPLFMVAALDHMAQRRFLAYETGGWKLKAPLEEIDLEVPDSLRAMVDTQIERLSEEEQQALEVACVNGVMFSAAVNAIPASLDEEKFEDLCESLTRREHIVRRLGLRWFPDGTVSPSYQFVHALYREVLYRRQAPGRRAKLHLRIAARMEHLFTNHENEVAAELADHFEEGGDWQRAIKYLRVAADTAGRRFEPRLAAEILEHALELLRKLPNAERAASETGILERLAGIYAALGDVHAFETYAALSARAAHDGLIDVQVRALVEGAFIGSWENSEHGLELLERALQLVRTLDLTMYLPAYAACFFFRLWLCGWNPQHAEEYRNVIGEIRKLRDPCTVAPHLLNYSCIQWCSSEYRASHRSYADGVKMLLDVDSVHPSLSDIRWSLWQNMHNFDLVLLGEWGDALREIEDGIKTANKNGDYFFQARALQVCRAYVHLQACDFDGVLTICESAVPLARDPVLRSAPDSPPPFPWPFQQSLILRGLAEAALGQYDHAREYLFTAKDDMDRQRTLNDWYWRVTLESGLTELWLAKGNLAQARPQAEQFLNFTLTIAERTWQTLAWEANARVALAELDVPRAQECISRALSTMEGFDLPLAHWRVHAAASELYRYAGDRELAETHRKLSGATIMKLANSLPAEESLQQKFLSAPMVRKILSDRV